MKHGLGDVPNSPQPYNDMQDTYQVVLPEDPSPRQVLKKVYSRKHPWCPVSLTNKLSERCGRSRSHPWPDFVGVVSYKPHSSGRRGHHLSSSKEVQTHDKHHLVLWLWGTEVSFPLLPSCFISDPSTEVGSVGRERTKSL